MRFGLAEFFHQLKSCLEALVNACVRSLYRRELLATVELSAFAATECLEEKLGLLAVEFDGEGACHAHYFKVLYMKWDLASFSCSQAHVWTCEVVSSSGSIETHSQLSEQGLSEAGDAQPSVAHPAQVLRCFQAPEC